MSPCLLLLPLLLLASVAPHERMDEVLFEQAHGSANLEWNIPHTLDAKFRLGQLHCQLTGDGKFSIDAETETRFFPVTFEARFEFRKEKGKVTGMVLRHGDHENFAKRVEE
jgi:hypothetical protein